MSDESEPKPAKPRSARSRKPWDKLDNESEVAYYLFKTWLGQPLPRPSARALSKLVIAAGLKQGTAPRTIDGYVIRHQWAKRAMAFDHEMMEAEFASRKREIAKISADDELQNFRSRVLATAMTLQTVGASLLAKVNKSINNLPDGAPVPSSTSAGARAGAHLLQHALDAEAALLGLDEIVRNMSHITAPVEIDG